MGKVSSFLNRLSISKRLAFWYGASLFVMLSVFGYFLYDSFHDSIHHNYDRHLRFEAEQLLPFIETGDTLSMDITGYSRNEALKSGIEYGTYVRLYDESGELIYRSPNFSKINEPLKTSIPKIAGEHSVSTEWQSMPARTLFYPIENDNGTFCGWLEVTGFEWTLHEELSRFRKYLFVLIALSVIFSIIGGYLLSRRALSPVSSIINTAKSITATDLDKRIPVNYQVKDELTDLADTFNIMLDRLQKGFEREKRFTADAAHELMTPLSSIRSDAEIMLRKSRSQQEYEQTLERVLDEVKRMSGMVDLLLQLSRIDSEQHVEDGAVNVSRIAEGAVQAYQSHADGMDITLETQIDPGLIVNAHGGYIEKVIHNLLENALKYTPEGGTINMQVKRSGGEAVIRIKDTGIGFDEDTKQHLFERFYRANEAAVQEQKGSGLGLSLCKAIVELYGGEISAYSKGIEKGSAFVVKLPLSETN